MNKLWLMCMLISSAINAQTFDFSCDSVVEYASISSELVPMIQDFITDLNDSNVVIENITAVLASRAELIDLTGYTPRSDNTVAFAFVRCNRNAYSFYYIKEHWDTQTDPFRKKVVYHELGHSVLKYRHSSAAWDIMGYNSLTALASQWANALVRFLAGTDQETICESSRSDIIIIDD